MDDPDKTPPQLGVLLYDALPDSFEADLLADLATEGLNIPIQRIPSGPFTGIELYLPAAAMLFVTTAYFTGFLQKAGEDHYELVKRGAKALWKRASRLRVTQIASAPGKISNTSFSLTYAIMGNVAPRLNFKFIVRAEIEEAEAEDGICAFLDLLRAIHADQISEADLEALLTYRPVGGTVLVTFDPKARQIIPVNAFDT